jgi:hypothetical protein
MDGRLPQIALAASLAPDVGLLHAAFFQSQFCYLRSCNFRLAHFGKDFKQLLV